MFDLQKASMLKRASAWLLDVILLSVLATGFALLLSAAFGTIRNTNSCMALILIFRMKNILRSVKRIGSVMLMHMQSLTMMPMSAGRFLL